MSAKTTAVYIGTHSFEVGDPAIANGVSVRITEIQGPIVHFQPAVEMGADKGVVLKSVESA